jgi:hypothetical protein
MAELEGSAHKIRYWTKSSGMRYSFFGICYCVTGIWIPAVPQNLVVSSIQYLLSYWTFQPLSTRALRRIAEERILYPYRCETFKLATIHIFTSYPSQY